MESNDEKKPQGVKPVVPPGVKPAGPPQGAKPAMPPGAKPAGPQGVKPAMPPGAKPAMPPGVQPAGPAAGDDPTHPKGARPDTPQPAGKRQPGTPVGVPSGTVPPVMPPGIRVPEPVPGEGDGAPLGAPSMLTRKDFATDQDVRWCPGCGDYAILAAVQRLMPELGIAKEKTVFISGIGCSSRFPYYMNTYGLHSIHGRAPAIASGLKASRPDLDVWIVTGDGDALSIGGNHLIHLMRRNLDVNLLLFNNQIYGLTKGQYSPTSEQGKITKSTPYGSIDHPFVPPVVALGAGASFVARTMDRDPQHITSVLRQAHQHKGSSFVEIYQNCNIFNDGAFLAFTEKETKAKSALFLEHGKPMVYDGGRRGIRLDGFRLQSVDLQEGAWSVNDCVVYDETSHELANIVAHMFWQQDLPRPFGVFYREERATYDDLLHTQIQGITEKRGKGDLDELLASGDTWEVA